MSSVHNFSYPALAAALLLVGGAAFADDSPRLVAPVYKGAVPAVLAEGVENVPTNTSVAVFGGIKALDCSPYTGMKANGPWCFLTRDPIDKVKGYYEKSVGPMRAIRGKWGRAGIPVQGYKAYVERAWFPGSGEDSPPGFAYAGVSLHALPAPPAKGDESAGDSDDSWRGQEAYKFYGGTRHFGVFLQGVDWFGDPSLHSEAELDALYKKHKSIESALFQRKGPKSEPYDEALRTRYSEKQTELTLSASNESLSAITQSQDHIQEMMQAAQAPVPAKQSASPEDDEFNAFMAKNPKVAEKFMDLTQRAIMLAQQGKFDEADAVDEELEELVQSNPELAELERRSDERSAAAGDAQQAAFNKKVGSASDQVEQANWGIWLDYLKDVEKEAYSTLIVIDSGFQGSEKDYSRDRAVIAGDKWAADSTPHPNVLDFTYVQTGHAQQAAGASSQLQPVAAPEASPEEAEPESEIKNAAKKGWKALKKVL